MASLFETLNALNVNAYTEKKDGLTYLSWANAWAEVKKIYPAATYEIYRNADGLPYAYDPNTGYMVSVKVTIDGLTHEMWLPVMDGKNKAMKAEPYKYSTKYGEKTVEAATMFDVNKTLMRCLVKALAMFGLGLYIYSGEDLPEGEEEQKPKQSPQADLDDKMRVLKFVNNNENPKAVSDFICKSYKVSSPSEMTPAQYKHFITSMRERGKAI